MPKDYFDVKKFLRNEKIRNRERFGLSTKRKSDKQEFYDITDKINSQSINDDYTSKIREHDANIFIRNDKLRMREKIGLPTRRKTDKPEYHSYTDKMERQRLQSGELLSKQREEEKRKINEKYDKDASNINSIIKKYFS